VGYSHAGVSVRLEVTKSARDLFERENVNSLKGLVELVGPHICFQM
jgi:hypothetical protein